jgi:hypothetical protein
MQKYRDPLCQSVVIQTWHKERKDNIKTMTLENKKKGKRT